MTATFDPHDSAYLDEADVRDELTRTFEVCRDCRACIELCSVFPTLFDLLDGTAQNDPGLLTPEEQDTVIDGCYRCNRCAHDCPYTPDRHPAAVDVPRLALRAAAMQAATGQRSIMHGLTAGSRTLFGGLDRLSGRRERSAGVSVVLAAIADRLGGHRLSVRLAAPSKRERFSTWFARHSTRLAEPRRGRVGIFPTCLVEYQASEVGRDLVRVFERTGIECALSGAGCCGAPWLHAGDIDRFRSMANDNVRALAGEIRAHRLDAVVVAEPTCRAVMEREYVSHVDPSERAAAELVVEHLVDPSAHLLRVCAADPTTWAGIGVRDARRGPVTMVEYHVACHARAVGGTSPGVDLIRTLGSDVAVVEACAGIGVRWESHDTDPARVAALRSGLRSAKATTDVVVVGDCDLANRMIGQVTGATAVHPMSYLADLFGVTEPSEE
jgi:Fe-S oxidoreductase